MSSEIRYYLLIIEKCKNNEYLQRGTSKTILFQTLYDDILLLKLDIRFDGFFLKFSLLLHFLQHTHRLNKTFNKLNCSMI